MGGRVLAIRNKEEQKGEKWKWDKGSKIRGYGKAMTLYGMAKEWREKTCERACMCVLMGPCARNVWVVCVYAPALSERECEYARD